jgi:hypothetical protein
MPTRKIYVIYYSMYGHVLTLARAIKGGWVHSRRSLLVGGGLGLLHQAYRSISSQSNQPKTPCRPRRGHRQRRGRGGRAVPGEAIPSHHQPTSQPANQPTKRQPNKQVAETLPPSVLSKMGAPAKPADIPTIDPHVIDEVRWYGSGWCYGGDAHQAHHSPLPPR